MLLPAQCVKSVGLKTFLFNIMVVVFEGHTDVCRSLANMPWQMIEELLSG